MEETAACTDESTSAGDPDGAATWRRIANAVGQLVNNTPDQSGPSTSKDRRGGVRRIVGISDVDSKTERELRKPDKGPLCGRRQSVADTGPNGVVA